MLKFTTPNLYVCTTFLKFANYSMKRIDSEMAKTNILL